MNKILTHLHTYILTSLLASCSLLEPGDVENPNVVEGDFLRSDGAMRTWVNGAAATQATAIGRICEYTELLSDNYYNNYTRSSKHFDALRFDYRSGEVQTIATLIGGMLESASYGLSTVATADHETTREERFTLMHIGAYAHLLAAELFTALPLEARGVPMTADAHLDAAIHELQEALPLANTASDRAFVHTLLARAYYNKSMATEAVAAARQALDDDPEAHHDVTFDGVNGVTNSLNEYIGAFMFQPLPRLDFLDPKYPSGAYWDSPVCTAKAEECHLIIAEAAIAGGDLATARATLRQLLRLVASRPAVDYTDTADDRNNGGVVTYPNGSDYRVAASPSDAPRAGLTRRHGPGSEPYRLATLSGTSVSEAMIDEADGHDALLELVYLLRQEIFIAEGRRATDLGLRLPLPETEAALHTDLPAEYTQPVIPPFIPANGELDAFTVDETTRTVTILHNMNREIALNARTRYVVPFE